MENYNVNYSVHLPSYSIGPDCYNEVPYVTRFFGKRLLSSAARPLWKKQNRLCLKA